MDNVLDSTWYYNHLSREFTTGPKLHTSRQWHSSGSLTDSGTNEEIIVVTGGWKPQYGIDSTIFLIDGIWQEGTST